MIAHHLPDTCDEICAGDEVATPRVGECRWCSVRPMYEGTHYILHRGQTTVYCEHCDVFLCSGGPVGRKCFKEYHLWRILHPDVAGAEVPQKACGRAACSHCEAADGRYPACFNQQNGYLKREIDFARVAETYAEVD